VLRGRAVLTCPHQGCAWSRRLVLPASGRVSRLPADCRHTQLQTVGRVGQPTLSIVDDDNDAVLAVWGTYGAELLGLGRKRGRDDPASLILPVVHARPLLQRFSRLARWSSLSLGAM
jgi:hypothetical protein